MHRFNLLKETEADDLPKKLTLQGNIKVVVVVHLVSQRWGTWVLGLLRSDPPAVPPSPP